MRRIAGRIVASTEDTPADDGVRFSATSLTQITSQLPLPVSVRLKELRQRQPSAASARTRKPCNWMTSPRCRASSLSRRLSGARWRIWRRMAGVTWGARLPVTLDTPFRWRSILKQLTALGDAAR